MIEQINAIAEIWWNWMWPMFWQVSLLVVIVGAVDVLLRRHIWPQLRYILWLLVLLKLVIPPTFALPTGLVPRLSLLTEQSSATSHVVRSDGHVENFPLPESPAETDPATASVAATPSTPNEEITRVPVSWRAMAMIVWLLGGVGLTTWLIAGYVRLSRIHCGRDSDDHLPESLSLILCETAKKLNLKRLPRIVVLKGMDSPAVFGIVRPVLLLPERSTMNLSEQETEHVLLHELAHVKRRDLQVHALCILLQIVYWFNPLVYLVRRHLQHIRELCCDATVAKILKDQTQAYCETILETAAWLLNKPSRSGIGFLGLVENPGRLLVRLSWLGKGPSKHPRLRLAIVSITVIAMLTCVLPMTKAQQRGPSEQIQEATSSSPHQTAQTLLEAAKKNDIEQVRLLIAQGADVNGKDKDGSTPLHEAAGEGWVDVARLLLEEGANVHAIDASGRTPLHRAARWGSRHMCEWFLAKGAGVNAKDSQGDTPLHASLRGNQVNRRLVEFLLAEGADVNARNEQGETPLHLAGRTGRTGAWPGQRAEAAEILLAHGAEINATDKSGRSPLHVAVENAQGKTVELLLAKGADIEAKNAEGATALNLAARKRFLNMNIAELLVNGGADVNSADSEGRTPLHYAARSGDKETVERLIAQGADVNAKDAHGAPPALLAAMWNRRDNVSLLLSKGADTSIQLAAYLGDLAQVKDFIENGIDVNPQGGYTPSPLFAAALGGQEKVAEFLLSEGARVNSAGNWEWTPLHAAVRAGSVGLAELLIRNGAEIDAKTKVQGLTTLNYAAYRDEVDGLTPLYYAAYRDEVDMARLLIAHGADVNVKLQGNHDGWTLLHRAALYGRKDLALLLLDHGVDINAQAADGTMPLELAARRGHEDMVRLLIDKGADLANRDILLYHACWNRQKDLVELLIQKGADVNSQTQGLTPVMAAIWVASRNAPELTGILKLLLDAGADPDTPDVAGWSPLHYAWSNVDLTKLLLEEGADPNIRTRDGDTPLHLVAEKGSTPVAQVLISRGADVNVKNSYGFTPLSIAESSDKDRLGEPMKTPLTDQVKAAKGEIAKLLREHGATE